MISFQTNLTMNFNYENTNPVKITLDVKGKAEVVHLPEQKTESSVKKLDELVKDLESRLEKDIMQMIKKMKSANVEPWLMGHRIWSSDHRYFETLNWEEKGWVDSEITCNIDIEVEKTGQRGLLEKVKIGR